MNIFKKIKNILLEIVNILFFLNKYRFTPPPKFSDLSNYNDLMDLIVRENCFDIDGDFVEIGCFLGGGTYKLSRLIEKTNKKIYTIDLFDPTFDTTTCIKGKKMSTIYHSHLKGRNQKEIYEKITEKCNNIVTLVGDSKKIDLPCKKISFGFIDGNHSSEYVKSDFYLLWSKSISGTIIAFDDYGYDLPNVTKTIHEIIFSKIDEIKKIGTIGKKIIWFQKK